MIDYLIVFHGTGYDFFTEDNQEIEGFYVSVIACAKEPEQAFEIAYQKLTNSQSYQDLIAGHEHPDAVLSVHQYSEFTEDNLNAPEISGFVFYPPDEQATENSSTQH